VPASELVLANARIVLDGEVVCGSVRIASGRIAAVDSGTTRIAAGIDLEGEILIPGLIDLHTDNLERQYQPRTGVEWDPVHAAIGHDVQVIGCGITTVYDGITIGAASGWDARAELVAPMLDGLREARDHDMLRADHLLHLRAEVTHPDIVSIFEEFLDDPLLRLLSLMDHAPGDRQSPDVADYRRRYVKTFDGDDAALEEHIHALIHGSRTFGEANRRQLAGIARRRGIPFASHDDARSQHVEEAAALGAALSEFPTTLEAARAAHERGLHVLMGSPNLIRGGSHSGNVAAGELARCGVIDILASDYIPASLLLAAFRLTREEFGFALPAAIATVTRNPADAAGLEDRGRIAPGLVADLVRVREVRGRPVVRVVWRAGERVA
jgi:alpha-D-ribose 1-methylphosphonate 5-triphosphate diphosphatase